MTKIIGGRAMPRVGYRSWLVGISIAEGSLLTERMTKPKLCSAVLTPTGIITTELALSPPPAPYIREGKEVGRRNMLPSL